MNAISTPAPSRVGTQTGLTTPVGRITIEADDRGVRRVGWTAVADDSEAGPLHPVLAEARDQLEAYFAGERHDFDLPVDLAGLTQAQRAVLGSLAGTVGWGETVSYGELAGRSKAGVPARAIGSIMGSNPIPIIIGCHRVVAADGIGGYSGGAPGRGRETKLWLLEHEGALPPALV